MLKPRIARLSFLFLLVGLCCSLWPTPAQAQAQANAFVYHRFGDARYPSTNISLEHFRRHLEILRQESFVVLTLGEVVDRLEHQVNLPDRCAVLTVDDAYKSFLTGAMPLLREFGYQATLFVSTDTVGGDGFLNWDELKQLQSEGIEIGNHSSSHAYLLNRLSGEDDSGWGQRITEDLENSQDVLSRHLGRLPELFAYPYGEYSQGLVEIVKKLGFRAAFAQQSGVIAPGDDLYTLARFPMGGGFTTPSEFREKLLMRKLPVELLAPSEPMVQSENPPRLRIRIDLEGLARSSLRCYVPGQEDAEITEVVGLPDVYDVRAKSPLRGRRSKYTLTASDGVGQQWFWFSHLWVFPGL